MNTRRTRIYEGKAKILYEGPEPGTLIVHYQGRRDGLQRAEEGGHRGQGRAQQPHFRTDLHTDSTNSACRRISSSVSTCASNSSARSRSSRSRWWCAMLPRVRSQAARHGGRHQPCPARSSSSITRTTSSAIPWFRRSISPRSTGPPRRRSTTSWHMAIRVNDFLSGLFLGIGIKLVDFKLEFGRLYEDDMVRIVVADEISPDCCRLWDIKTERQARQGSLPPRPGRPGRGLSGSGAPARHHARTASSRSGREPVLVKTD